ncbi:putative LOC107389088-like protein, partial [Nothobranchius furzeri]
MANSKANGKAIKALLPHDYACQEAMETNLRGTKNLLTSPGKAALPLKKQRGHEEAAISAEASVILAAVESLKNSIEELRGDLKQNTLTIASIVKAVDFNSGEIKDLKEKNKGMTEEIKLLKATNLDLTAKLLRVEKMTEDQESYKRQWNLRLNDLKEEKDEDTRKKVAGVLIKILPHWAEKVELILDTVHRLGTPLNGRPRQIILQFSL